MRIVVESWNISMYGLREVLQHHLNIKSNCNHWTTSPLLSANCTSVQQILFLWNEIYYLGTYSNYWMVTWAEGLHKLCFSPVYHESEYSKMEFFPWSPMRPNSFWIVLRIIEDTFWCCSLAKATTRWRKKVWPWSSTILWGNLVRISWSISSTASLPEGCS